MEARIQEALAYMANFPEAKLTTVAREFSVPRKRLRNRREGVLPKAGQPAANTKLSGPEEKALCRYIDRLDSINLTIQPEFVTDVVNAILRERSGR